MYHTFIDKDGQSYGSFETFHMTKEECDEANGINPDYPVYDGPGWYWWPCFPGCLPDCEPVGPFESEEKAVINANEAEVMY